MLLNIIRASDRLLQEEVCPVKDWTEQNVQHFRKGSLQRDYISEEAY
jgi:hypothetical protein